MTVARQAVMTSGRRELRSQPCSTRDGALPLCCMARGRPASQANCRIGIVGKAGAAAASVGPGGDLAPKILPYLEAVGDRAELQDVRRFSPDVFRVGDGAAAVIALRDSDVKQGVVNAVVHVLGAALVVRCGAGRLRHGSGIVDGGAAGRDDERSAGIAEPALLNPGWRFAIVLHGPRAAGEPGELPDRDRREGGCCRGVRWPGR